MLSSVFSSAPCSTLSKVDTKCLCFVFSHKSIFWKTFSVVSWLLTVKVKLQMHTFWSNFAANWVKQGIFPSLASPHGARFGSSLNLLCCHGLILCTSSVSDSNTLSQNKFKRSKILTRFLLVVMVGPEARAVVDRWGDSSSNYIC